MNRVDHLRIIKQPRVRIARILVFTAMLCGVFGPGIIPRTNGVAAANPPPSTVVPGAPGQTFWRRLGGPNQTQPQARIGQPVRLKIATIGVDAPVERVGQSPDGAMDVPKDFNDTAWYQLGPRPGEPGNAVIDGHVDSVSGKAVFWDLRKLVAGDQIVVVGEDGAERRFAVKAVETYRTADVPLNRVFGPSPGAHLNLITCDQTSAFDQSSHSYDSNLIVYSDAIP